MSRPTWFLAALVIAALAVAVVIWRDDGGESPAGSSEPTLVEVAGLPLAVPMNALRFADQRRPGPHPRLDLALLAPEMQGRDETNTARFDVAGEPPDVVWLTLTPVGGEMDSAGRLATIYRRFFVGDPLAPIAGLDGRHLSPKAGYGGEEVWYEPGAVHPFVARCWPLVPGGEPTTCHHEEAVAGLMIGWRFPKAMLATWAETRERLRARLAQWGVPREP